MGVGIPITYPGGLDTELQFNDNGSFGAVSILIYNGSQLTLDQNADAIGLEIDSEASSDGNYGFYAHGKYAVKIEQDITGGRGLLITRNIAAGQLNPLVEIVDEHADAGVPTLVVRNDSTSSASGSIAEFYDHTHQWVTIYGDNAGLGGGGMTISGYGDDIQFSVNNSANPILFLVTSNPPQTVAYTSFIVAGITTLQDNLNGINCTITVDENVVAAGWVDAGTLRIQTGQITCNSGAISFGDENLSTLGTLASGIHTVDTTLVLASGSITSTTGTISFGDENLSTTGTLASGTHTVSSTLVLASGSITSTTGAISFGNENLSTTGTLASGTHTIGTLTIAAASIIDSTGTISFGNDHLTTTGTIIVGTLTVAAGSITDSSGAITFVNENLSTTGTLASGTHTIGGDLVLASGSITSASGTIDFGNENLITTGTITFGGGITFGTLLLAGGSITDTTGAIDFGNENLSTSGAWTIGTMTIASGSITDSSGTVNFGDEQVRTTGILRGGSAILDGTVTISSGSIVCTTGTISFGDENLTTTGYLTSPRLILDAGSTSYIEYSSDKIRFKSGGDGVNLDGLPLEATGNVTIGVGAVGVDYKITFNGETNDGILTWDEDNAIFAFDSYISATGFAIADVDTGGLNCITIGIGAGAVNNNGDNNVFIGADAGESTTTGDNNAYIGYQAGQENVTGAGCTAIGRQAGQGAATYSWNQSSYIGDRAGRFIRTGGNNVGIGYAPLYYNLTGSANTCIGRYAGFGAASQSYSNNTFIGMNCGYSNRTGSYNTFIGSNAGRLNTTGASNVYIGYQAAYNETTQSDTLWIQNDNSATPLIKGDFSARWVKLDAALYLLEKSADPTEPAEGECVVWMSDGTGKGDDGDVLIASKAGGTTKWTTLFDHSAGAAW